MPPLDDPATYALDASGMFDHIAATGSELVRSWDACDGMRLPQGANRATSLVIAGMGGSATAGDYFVQLCNQSAEIPASVVRGPELPNFVSEETLVVVASHSGNTQETLAAYDDAWKRGATLLVVTTGGELARRAVNDGAALHLFASSAPPRAAMPQGLAPLLQLGRRTGMANIERDEVVRAGEAYRRIIDECPRDTALPGNRAKQIASTLFGRLPLVVGALHLSVAATRFKNQLAENGKALAGAESFPEAGHNLVVGLASAAALAERVALVTLEPGSGWPNQRTKLDELTAMFAEAPIPVLRIAINEDTLLAELMVATAWGDLVSFYLGLLNGQDPTPIPQIERLRRA